MINKKNMKETTSGKKKSLKARKCLPQTEFQRNRRYKGIKKILMEKILGKSRV